ncbi:MAG: 50S ribosomal protein L22 [Patescibacteria group bacterium]
MEQRVTAKLNFLRMGPRKVRLVIDLIRGRKVTTAINTLSLLNKKAARPVLKLLNSAIANAKNNYSLPIESLRVETAMVDGGRVLKRSMPKAHGSATPVRERTSHVSLILVGSKEEKKGKEEKKEKIKEKK